MDDDIKVLERIYDRFNARDINGVLAVLTVLALESEPNDPRL